MIAIHNLSKSFGGVPVLRDVSLDIGAGEIHALVGANGSGKSTIVKSLSGYHDTVDFGEVTIHGKTLPLPLRASTANAQHIRFVHQDLGLVEQMSLVDNVCLYAGYAQGRLGRIRPGPSRAAAAEALEQLGVIAHPEVLVHDLGPTERVIVAVARATATREAPGVLVLDEPTAAIPVDDIARIVEVVRSRKRTGWAVLYISHRLDEVLDLADRVSVLRDGRLVASRRSGEFDAHELSDVIVGELQVAPLRDLEVAPAGPAAARDERREGGLAASGLNGIRLRDIDLEVKPGEVVGVTGPTGCGKSELGRMLSGAQQPISGTIRIGGKTVVFAHPRDALDAGVGYVPQDRARQALMPKGSVRENISGIRLAHAKRGIRISARAETATARRWIKAFNVRPPDPERPITTLSGGNQQKTVLARAVQSASAVLVLDDPTAGVDVGARAQIQEIIRELAESGLAIVLLSTELDELIDLADRILVLRRGTISTQLESPVAHDQLARAVFAGSGVREQVGTE
jgi:ribose transport system ATP-binding protein